MQILKYEQPPYGKLIQNMSAWIVKLFFVSSTHLKLKNLPLKVSRVAKGWHFIFQPSIFRDEHISFNHLTPLTEMKSGHRSLAATPCQLNIDTDENNFWKGTFFRSNQAGLGVCCVGSCLNAVTVDFLKANRLPVIQNEYVNWKFLQARTRIHGSK